MKIDFSRLEMAFTPQRVAVVGDSKRNNFGWLRAQSTFTGKLYSVQVNPETIEGIKALGVENYTSLMDIPEAIDLAIVAVPRTAIPDVLEDCIRKNVAAVHLFAAGFAETNTAEGKELERQLAEQAERANLHVIGPNCFGIFNPEVGLRQSEEQYTGGSGSVGFISQSGNIALSFSLEAHLQGIDLNKSVSFGNGVVLDSPDYLEYFGQDSEIKAIGMYLEGVKDGKRLLKVLKEVAARKPVVILKGGRTEVGRRAIASHTASLAMPDAIWNAVVKQCGAIKVSRMEELADALTALVYLPPVLGDRVAIAGGSGGQSVAMADLFVETGLILPPLTQKSYDEFASFFSLVGGSYVNPVDTGGTVSSKEIRRIMEILERDASIDNLALMINTRWVRRDVKQVKLYMDVLIETRKRSSKPVMAIVHSSVTDDASDTIEVTRTLQENGIPSFPSIERAAFALKKALDYYNRKRSIST